MSQSCLVCIGGPAAGKIFALSNAEVGFRLNLSTLQNVFEPWKVPTSKEALLPIDVVSYVVDEIKFHHGMESIKFLRLEVMSFPELFAELLTVYSRAAIKERNTR